MTQQIESELHDAFCTLVSSIPAESGVRLRAIDYRPRTARLSPRLTVGAVGGVVASAGTVVSIVVLGSAQPAFAGWTAAPSAASGAQATSADSACQAKIASSPGLAGTSTGSGWNDVTTDVRGPFTVAILEDGGSVATCFTGPSFTVLSQSSADEGSMSVSGSETRTAGAAGSASVMVEGTSSGDITHMVVAHLDSSEGSYTLVEGQIQPGVTGVTLARSDGSDVQATTGGGWLVAWWPGAQDVTSAEVSSANGVTNEPLSVQPAGPQFGTGTRTCSVGGGQTAANAGVCAGATGGPAADNQGG
jgi:hypothetical protein